MTAAEAWDWVLERLQTDMPRRTFGLYVKDIRLVSYEMGCFTIAADSPLTRSWLEERLTSTVRRLLIGCMKRAVEVKFIYPKDGHKCE